MIDGPALAWPWVLVPSPCGRVFVCVCVWGGAMRVARGWSPSGSQSGPVVLMGGQCRSPSLVPAHPGHTFRFPSVWFLQYSPCARAHVDHSLTFTDVPRRTHSSVSRFWRKRAQICEVACPGPHRGLREGLKRDPLASGEHGPVAFSCLLKSIYNL